MRKLYEIAPTGMTASGEAVYGFDCKALRLSPNMDPIHSRTESRSEMYRVPIFKPRRTDGRMFTSLMMLAAEANGVIALRMMKLMRGGNAARFEAELMVREKMDAAIEATASLMTGASGDRIVRRYRKRVAANAKRLSGLNSNRSQKRKPRRK